MAAGRPEIVLLLQGGGALGAYQLGAYRALVEQGLGPDWVCGISIGAVNAAVIAGNPAELAADRMDALWDAIASPVPSPAVWGLGENWGSIAQAYVFGQPNFYRPRLPSPLLTATAVRPEEASWYDTSPLRGTLERFVDFARIGPVRLSLGATDIAAGTQVFFDSRSQAIRPEHVLASCSLPPAFPPTLVDGRYYWDGGVVANTPIDAIAGTALPPHRVIFLVDLWSRAGPVPRTLDEITWREKEILYASRADHHVQSAANRVRVRQMADETRGRLDIVHVVYRRTQEEPSGSDAEFSRESIARRRAAGLADMRAAIKAAPWRWQAGVEHLGVVTHRVDEGQVRTLEAQPIGSA